MISVQQAQLRLLRIVGDGREVKAWNSSISPFRRPDQVTPDSSFMLVDAGDVLPNSEQGCRPVDAAGTGRNRAPSWHWPLPSLARSASLRCRPC
jgi:hypothetical protein